MNKFYVLLFFVLVYACATSNSKLKDIDTKSFRIKDVSYAKKSISAGKLNDTKFIDLKNHVLKYYRMNLDSISYLTIAYIKPQSSCWYNNYSHIGKSKSEITKSYYQAKSNHSIIYLYHDSKYSDEIWKKDIDGVVYNLFLEGKGNTFCDYNITISKYGDYLFKKGHFDVAVTNAFKNELENYDQTYRN